MSCMKTTLMDRLNVYCHVKDMLKVVLSLTLWSAKQCPIGLQYQECISCCPQTCSLERSCIDSKLACLDGCYCPEGRLSLLKICQRADLALISFPTCCWCSAGLIFEDGACVTPSDCPCEHRGSLYQSGQTLQEECNNWWAACSVVSGIIWRCCHAFLIIPQKALNFCYVKSIFCRKA